VAVNPLEGIIGVNKDTVLNIEKYFSS